MEQYVILVFILVGVAMFLAFTWECFFERYRARREVVMQQWSDSMDSTEQHWETKSLETESILDK